MKKYKLPKEFAEKWVAALRSGGYGQDIGERQLYVPKTDCYCADGVYAKVNGYEFNEAGTSAYHPLFKAIYRDEMYPLMKDVYTLNDDERMSFPEIADWITENVEFTTP